MHIEQVQIGHKGGREVSLPWGLVQSCEVLIKLHVTKVTWVWNNQAVDNGHGI